MKRAPNPDFLFSTATVCLALLGIISQISSPPLNMIPPIILAVSTIILTRKAKDENNTSLMVVSTSLNLLFLPIFFLQISENPLVRAALVMPFTILQFEAFLELTRKTSAHLAHHTQRVLTE